jgi:putative Mg2+ transporter-C (MgtC) family protein
VAQGIMTGIGFLGAGTILKDGMTVRGLTTAASIWITAAIGVLIGVGFYFPAVMATVFTLLTLSLFRWIEDRIPVQFYAQFQIRFAREDVMPEDQVRNLLKSHHFTIAHLNYRLDVEDNYFEYRMVIRTHRAQNASRLTLALSALPAVKEFRLSPTGD